MRTEAYHRGLQLAELLKATRQKLVLAESCTAGNIAASLGTLPGISQCLCGSFVVYRSASKSAWLDVPVGILDDPSIGPVSAQVTALLAQSALSHTPEAEVSLAITGHLGPDAPAALDGLVYLHSVRRSDNATSAASLKLANPSPRGADDFQARSARMQEATNCALNHLLEFVGRAMQK